MTVSLYVQHVVFLFKFFNALNIEVCLFGILFFKYQAEAGTSSSSIQTDDNAPQNISRDATTLDDGKYTYIRYVVFIIEFELFQCIEICLFGILFFKY